MTLEGSVEPHTTTEMDFDFEIAESWKTQFQKAMVQLFVLLLKIQVKLPSEQSHW